MGGDCLARVSVSLFVDRESEESPEEPNGRTVSQESQSLCLLTEKMRRVPSGRRLSRKSLSLFVC